MSTSERFPWQTRRYFLLQVLAAAAAGGCGNGVGPGDDDDSSSGGDDSEGTTPTTGEPGTTSGTTGETGATDETTGAPQPELPSDPFTLGIASGDPLPTGVILWTRLVLDPSVAGGGMPDEPVSVFWEIATDDQFTQCVLMGNIDAEPMFAHSVHVDAHGLVADTWYYYRFKVGEWTSPTGRTRTLPTADSSPARLRFATACCHSYTDGYYTAYPHMAAEELDLVIFLGDYIYEDAAIGPVRSHGTPEPTTLDEYRVRYGLYKSDPNLQQVHQRFPWAMIWDDHEVEDNYAADISKDKVPTAEWLARRAAAYQAYYEHMPLRLPPPEGPEYKIYHALQWGDLAEFWLLDTRQYRDDQTCNDSPGPACDGWETYDGTVLGDEQEKWLEDGMKASTATWKLITQQIVMSSVSKLPRRRADRQRGRDLRRPPRRRPRRPRGQGRRRHHADHRRRDRDDVDLVERQRPARDRRGADRQRPARQVLQRPPARLRQPRYHARALHGPLLHDGERARADQRRHGRGRVLHRPGGPGLPPDAVTRRAAAQ
jgi:alkaline phosphatase D